MRLRVYRREKRWPGVGWVLCRVMGIPDGDGFWGRVEGCRYSVRIWGIDAPELGQPGFLESRAALRDLVGGKGVWCESVCYDRYGRAVCRVKTPAGVDVGLSMVTQGWAWWYRRFAWRDVELKEAMEKARDRGVGLWSGFKMAPPWIFRREKRGRG